MIIGFGNNTVSSLAADITANQTTIQVMPGEGAKFAKLLSSDYVNTSNPLKVYAKITLTDAKETVFEVCHLTAVNNDMLTVVRGQEGTTAKGWALNDVVANFATRGSENQFVQIEQLQSGNYTSAVAGGSANALTIELPATYFINSSTDWALRTPIVVYPTQNNTGASTLQLVMGGRVLGTFPLYKGNRAQLVANDILKDVGLVCLMDKTKTFFNVANPGAIYAGLGTAAFKDVVTSMTDVTGDRIPVVGWMGLGANVDIQMGTVSQFLASGSAVGQEVPTNGAGWQAAYNPARRAQAFIGGDAKFYSRFSSSSTVLDATTPWAIHYTTLNPPPSATLSVKGIVQLSSVTNSESEAYAATPKAVKVANDNANGRLSINDGGTVSGVIKCTQEFQTTSSNSYRQISGDYGYFWRNDGSRAYLMLTNKGDQYGSYNNLRPFSVVLSTGAVSMENGLTLMKQLDISSGGTGGNTVASALENLGFSLSAGGNGGSQSGLGGLTVQWGDWAISNVNAGAGVVVTFPRTFPTACVGVFAIPINGAPQQIGYRDYSRTGCTLTKGAEHTGSTAGRYFAIGY